MALGRLHHLLNSKSQLSLKSKVRLYTTCIRPIMTYASVVFAQVSPRRTHPLQVIQNRFMRKATGAPWFVRNECLHVDLGLPTIRQYLKCLSLNYFDSAEVHPNPLMVAAVNYTPSAISRTRRPRHVLGEPDDETTVAQLAAEALKPPSQRTRPRRRGKAKGGVVRADYPPPTTDYPPQQVPSAASPPPACEHLSVFEQIRAPCAGTGVLSSGGTTTPRPADRLAVRDATPETTTPRG